jgi:UDP-N-acetyl-2-amino-2-deoxyglucuronate dehydrogenase
MRLGSIGLGRWGSQLATTALAAGSTIESCFSPTLQSRETFAAAFDCSPAESLEQLLSNPRIEGVLIASPNASHADIACDAATASKHILVEKPLALSVEDAVRSVAAAREANVVLQTGHSRRRVDAVRKLKGLVDAEDLGLVLQAEATTTRHSPNLEWFNGWRHDPAQAPLGGMTAIGVHMLDNLHYLLGPSAKVFATSRKTLPGQGLDDATVLVIEFRTGAVAYLGVSVRVAPSFVLKLMGTEATAWTDDPRTMKAGASSRLWRQATAEDSAIQLSTFANDPLAEQFAEFVECCRTGAEPETGGKAGLAVVALMEAAIESNRTAVAVPVPDVGQWD